MLTFILTLLYLLLYAAIILLCLWGLCYLFEMVFGRPVPPRVKQIIIAIVGILMLIFFLQSMVSHTPIMAPWQMVR